MYFSLQIFLHFISKFLCAFLLSTCRLKFRLLYICAFYAHKVDSQEKCRSFRCIVVVAATFQHIRSTPTIFDSCIFFHIFLYLSFVFEWHLLNEILKFRAFHCLGLCNSETNFVKQRTYHYRQQQQQ